MEQVFHATPGGHLISHTLGQVMTLYSHKRILLLCIPDLCSQIHRFLGGSKSFQWYDHVRSSFQTVASMSSLPSSACLLCWHAAIKCRGGRIWDSKVWIWEGESKWQERRHIYKNHRCQTSINQPSRKPGLGKECETASRGAKHPSSSQKNQPSMLLDTDGLLKQGGPRNREKASSLHENIQI